METFDQSPPPMDPTKASLRYILSDYGLTDGVTRYEEECVDLIIENLYKYMKSVIHKMVKHKRTYEIIYPLLMDEEEKESKEKTDESKKKLKPWETPFDFRKVSPEFMKKIEENDLKEAKESALMKSRSSQKGRDMKSKPSLNKKDTIDDSSVKVIEILKNLHDKPQEKEVQTRGKEETNVSQEGKFPQQNKQNSSKELEEQDESMDIVDVSEDEQSASQVDDNVKYQNKKSRNSQSKNMGMRNEGGENRSFYVSGKRVSRQMFEKYDRSKIHAVIKVCKKCGKMWEGLEAIPCELCEKAKESSKKGKKESKKRSKRQRENENISVARYPSKVFDVKDMFELFRRDPLIVPLGSIYQVMMKRIANDQPSESSYFNYQGKVEKCV